MFNSIKNALKFGKAKPEADSQLPAAANSALAPSSQMSKVSEWASLQGFQAEDRGSKGFKMDGNVAGKLWRLEMGKPSRDFIAGTELRARGEMDVRDDVAIMVMSRELKNELDKRAFNLYTDNLETMASPNLPEEMRWLSMYEEVGWESLGKEFFDHYAILADRKENAESWVTPELAQPLLAWPSKEPGVPRVLMVLRGKVYLRMQINPSDIPTLEHATRVFTMACDAALSGLSTDLSV
jgi:hypothetical protein